MKDNVLEKTNEIVNYIKNSPDYIKYLSLREQVKNNSEINSLIEEIKALQKKAVLEESRGNNIKIIDEKIKSKLQKLDAYPLYSEFSYIIDDLNEEMTNISKIIENYVNSKIN